MSLLVNNPSPIPSPEVFIHNSCEFIHKSCLFINKAVKRHICAHGVPCAVSVLYYLRVTSNSKTNSLNMNMFRSIYKQTMKTIFTDIHFIYVFKQSYL